MSEQRDDGGPAFPRSTNETMLQADCLAYDGMSLRDWFAGMALQGFMANPNVIRHSASYGYIFVNSTRAELMEECYANADAMLKARNQ